MAPVRAANGYRLYDAQQIEVVAQIRRLNDLGIPLRDVRPFVDCLNSGSSHGDDCPSSLAEYRHAIDRIDRTVQHLTTQRAALVENLDAASARLLAEQAPVDAANPNLAPLPADLPVPIDDGAADHLWGARLPSLSLPSTDHTVVDLGDLGPGRTLLYVFPMTGEPGTDMPDGWDNIPGARGCSPHNCDMRDHYAELMQAGVRRVFGLSSQRVEYQEALTKALRLPYPLLTDARLDLANDPGLPTLQTPDLTVFRRLALIIEEGVIRQVFYPVFPPDKHAAVVLEWLRRG